MKLITSIQQVETRPLFILLVLDTNFILKYVRTDIHVLVYRGTTQQGVLRG